MASTSAPPEVRSRVRIYWPIEQQWFEGTVDRISEQHGVQYFRVSYDDADVQWHAANETWECLRISKRTTHDHLTSSANCGSTVLAKRIKDVPSRGQRISVYWQDEGKWFEGTVRDYDRCSRCHLIVYDDGDQRHENLEDDPKLQWSICGKSKISHGTDGALAVQLEQAVWACCDKCGKWRRVFDTAEEDLPEKWQCVDHPDELTCHDPEDEMDADEQWDGVIAEAAPTEASEFGKSESPNTSAPSPPDARQHTLAETSSRTGIAAPRARAAEAQAPVLRTYGSTSRMVDFAWWPPSTAQSPRRQVAAPEVPALVMTTADDHKPAKLLTMAPPAARATNATTSATNGLPTGGTPTGGTSQNAHSLRHGTLKLTPPAFAKGDLVYVPFDDRQLHLGTVVDWHQRGTTAIGRPLFAYSVLFTDGEAVEGVGEDEMKPAGPVASGVEEPLVVRRPTAEQLEKQLEKAPSQLEPLPTASIPRELMVNGAAHCGGDLCFPNLTLADPRLGCRMPVFMMAPGAVAAFSGAKLCHCTTEHHAERSGGCAAHVSFAVQTPALTLGLHKQPSKRAEVETELHTYGVMDSMSKHWREAVWLPVWHACDAPSPKTRLFHDESLMCALPWRRIVLYDAEKDQRSAHGLIS